MADKTRIEWSDATWNPIVGCSIVSPGCRDCYAMRDGHRLGANPKTAHYAGLTEIAANGKPIWNGQVRFVEHALDRPLRWRRPRAIFVNSMGDLFHESVPDEWIDRVFSVMALASQHRFQVLTKRAERMRNYLHPDDIERTKSIVSHMDNFAAPTPYQLPAWPLPNVWLGVSAEDQKTAEARIPFLLDTPAAIRFLSAEPLLGPIDLRRLRLGRDHCDLYLTDRELYLDALTGTHEGLAKDGPLPQALAGLDWVIAGGESGAKARPMHPDWPRALRDQCMILSAFHFKQWGEWFPGIVEPSDDGPPWRRAYPDIEHDPTACDWEGRWTGHDFPDGEGMLRVGKKRAGRTLDGREWNEMPA